MEAANEAVEARHEELDGLPCLLAGRWTSALNEATQPLYPARGVELGPLPRGEADRALHQLFGVWLGRAALGLGIGFHGRKCTAFSVIQKQLVSA